MAHHDKCSTNGCNNFVGSNGKNRGSKYVCRACDAMHSRARQAKEEPTAIKRMTRQELEAKYWNMKEKQSPNAELTGRGLEAEE